MKMQSSIIFIFFVLVAKSVFACPEISNIAINGSSLITSLNKEYTYSVTEVPSCTDTVMIEENPNIKVTYINKHSFTVAITSANVESFNIIYLVYDTCGNSKSVFKVVTVNLDDLSKLRILQAMKTQYSGGTYSKLSAFEPVIEICAGDTLLLFAAKVNTAIDDFDVFVNDHTVEMSDGLRTETIKGYFAVIASNQTSGLKTVSFIYKSDTDVKISTSFRVYQKIDIRNLTVDKLNVCRGATIKLAAECYNASKVTWRTESGKNTFSDTSATNATLKCENLSNDKIWYVAKNACNRDSISKSLSISQPYSEPIGVVTAFEDDKPYIAVAWNRTTNKGVVSYEVLKEIETNIFKPQVKKDFNRDYGIWIDSNSNSNQQPYNYKLRTYDTCGNYAESAALKSLHLTRNKQESQYAMYWNRYNSKASTVYTVYRINPDYSMVTVGTVPATEGTDIFTFTISPPVPNAVYRIGYAVPEVKPKSFKTDTGPFSQSFSNMSEVSLVNFPLKTTWSKQIYPNPARTEFTVATNNAQCIRVLRLDGSIQWECADVSEFKLIPCAYWERGAYIVQIISNGIVDEQVLIVE